jgi:hypothetical protein
MLSRTLAHPDRQSGRHRAHAHRHLSRDQHPGHRGGLAVQNVIERAVIHSTRREIDAGMIAV